MKKEVFKTVLPAALAVLSVVPAGAMPPAYGWLFIALAVAASVLLYGRLSAASDPSGLPAASGEEDSSDRSAPSALPSAMASSASEKGRSRVLLIAGCLAGMIAVLALSVHASGSAPAFGRKILALFEPDSAQREYVRAGEVMNRNEAFIRWNTARAERLAGIANQLSDMQEEMERLSDSMRERCFWKDKADPKEMEGMLERIKEEYESYALSLPRIKTDRDEVELFYKMRLSRRNYSYASILSAMEAYGIPCRTMSIDEYMLMEWDTEVVFAKYAMMHSLGADIADGAAYEAEKEYFYDDYRLKDRNENSDTFDYRDWRYNGEETAEKTQEELIKRMQEYYRKWYRNFSGS